LRDEEKRGLVKLERGKIRIPDLGALALRVR